MSQSSASRIACLAAVLALSGCLAAEGAAPPGESLGQDQSAVKKEKCKDKDKDKGNDKHDCEAPPPPPITCTWSRTSRTNPTLHLTSFEPDVHVQRLDANRVALLSTGVTSATGGSIPLQLTRQGVGDTYAGVLAYSPDRDVNQQHASTPVVMTITGEVAALTAFSGITRPFMTLDDQIACTAGATPVLPAAP